MAICRTLIRTYAPENPTAPEEVLNSVNWRILDDTCANEFVTVFYGVLDLSNSQLTYANAGHNPPLLAKGSGLISLMRTGLPLGINDLTSWESRSVTLDEGDLLLLYTDGVSDAMNEKEEHFGEERLTDFFNNHNRMNAADFQQALLETLQDFIGGANQFDDITLIVLKKEKQTDSLVGLTL
jgi:sigma-B regulation protein RsbU (phosphoserine phosphatase)